MIGRFMARFGENVCVSKWKEGTVAQSNFKRTGNMQPLPRAVEWVDAVPLPIQPPFVSEEQERNAALFEHSLRSKHVLI